MGTNFVDVIISAPLFTYLKKVKNKKNYKFDPQRYFNMKIVFNGLNQPFRLLNLRYEHKSIRNFMLYETP
jgi:hypothetical protein